ncbi:DUF6597 domain-containing transcriptional factor, partial [Rhodocytophaga aerolata]
MTNLKTIIFEFAQPCKQLDGLVSHFWQSRWRLGVQNYFCYYSTANTNAELVFAFSPKNAHRSNSVFATFQGFTQTPSQIHTGGFSEMFGVSIYAHAIPLLFGVRVAQVANQLIDVKDLLDRDAEVVTKQLAEGDHFAERVNILTHHLSLRLNKTAIEDLVMLKAIKRIREMQGQVDIRSLASECSLSQKQFERRFKNFCSFNPKLYSRIVRFESTLFPDRQFDSYTDMALELGYYDQAHFNNEFKQFS